ncbi:transglycosylase SLT domain-containing protein [Candidatus Woesearchaeota archaeon]|nr:transglycosylase SLT domain-containing protein [Candidatus Woesearchaeota archaeon]
MSKDEWLTRRRFLAIIGGSGAAVMGGLAIHNGCNPDEPQFICPSGLSERELEVLSEYVTPNLDTLSAEMALAIIKKESNFEQNAVSRSGAAGLMQIGLYTGHHMGLDVFAPREFVDTEYRFRGTTEAEQRQNMLRYREALLEQIEQSDNPSTLDDRLDPAINVREGIGYFEHLLEQFNDEGFAIIGYNLGPTALRELQRQSRFRGRSPEEFVRTLITLDHADWRYDGSTRTVQRPKIEEVSRYFWRVNDFSQEYRQRLALSIMRLGDELYGDYVMERGDTIYSLLLRYSPLHPSHDSDQFQSAIETIMEMSDIGDETAISIGHHIKIPLELLSEDFHPHCDTAPSDIRVEEPAPRSDVQADADIEQPNGDVRNIHLILASGHGGGQTGGSNSALRLDEPAITFDVMARMIELAADDERIRVHPITAHPDGYIVRDDITRDDFWRQIYVDSSEPYTPQPGRGRAGMRHTHLRPFVANRAYRELRADGVPHENIMFLELHTNGVQDTSIRGCFVVMMDGTSHNTPDRLTDDISFYRRFAEYNAQPSLSFNNRETRNSMAEAYGRTLKDGLNQLGIPTWHRRPVFRRQLNVLRSQLTEPAVLIEMEHHSNDDAAEYLALPQNRQRIARALINSTVEYYARERRR